MNGLALLPLLMVACVWGFIGMYTAENTVPKVDKLQTTVHNEQVEITTLKAELAKAGIIIK